MMKRRLVIYFCLCLLVGSLFSQSKSSVFMDSEFWRSLGGNHSGTMYKRFYLLGLQDGAMAEYLAVALSATRADSREEEDLITKVVESPFMVDVTHASYEKTISGIDELYNDPSNRNIPVFAIATFVNKRIMGKIREQDVSAELERLRSVNWDR